MEYAPVEGEESCPCEGPASPHFNDQSALYAAGALRPVYFYPDELAGHVERRYRPGQ